MIAWMGHELKRVNEEVDIRNFAVDAIHRIPLGSYASDLHKRDVRNNKAGRLEQRLTEEVFGDRSE